MKLAVPFLLVPILAGCVDADGPSEAPVDSCPVVQWPGSYAVDEPRYRMANSLELRPDGTYEALFWQGLMTSGGCGGPFVGDGSSRGRWHQSGQRVLFTVDEEAPGLHVSLAEAVAVPQRTSQGDSLVLKTLHPTERDLALTQTRLHK